MILYRFILFITLFWGVHSISAQSAETIAQQVLDMQAVYWNQGDIEGFMQTYWKSDELLFLGKEGYTKGWQQTLDNYHRRYPNRQAMGRLKFTLDEVHQRSGKVISIIGQYHLDRDGLDNLRGYFMLLMRKIKGEWLIVADSTH